MEKNMEKGKKMTDGKPFGSDYIHTSNKMVVNKEKTMMHQSNKKIFIGPDFQANLPDLFLPEQRILCDKNNYSKATLIWHPTDTISNDQLDALVHELKPRGLSEDQILAFLCFKKYDIDATLDGLNNAFIGRHEGMPLHDKVIFSQGYNFHGKNFDRIAALLPGYTLQTLINHYYTEFKRSKTSKFTINRPEAEVRKLAKEATDNANKRYVSSLAFGQRLKALREMESSTASVETVTEGILSEASGILWRDGDLNDSRDESMMALEKMEPDELMDLNAEQKLDAKIVVEKAKLAELTAAREQAIANLTQAKESLTPKPQLLQNGVLSQAKEECQKEPTAVWSHAEITVFMKSLVEFGTDFAKTSQLLPTKTEQQIRNMFYNRQKFYGLDKLVDFHQERRAAEALKSV